MRSSILRASGSRSGGIFETRSSYSLQNYCVQLTGGIKGTLEIAGIALLALIPLGLIINAKDIARYIRISMM